MLNSRMAEFRQNATDQKTFELIGIKL